MEPAQKPAEAPKPKNRTMLYAIIVVVLIVVGVGVYYLTRSPSGGFSIAIQDDSACAQNSTACLYNPSTYNATVNGAAVVWKNQGGAPHTVTTCDSTSGIVSTTTCPNGANASGLDSFNSGTMAQRTGTFSHTFAKAGTYYYYCSIHLWMHGTVIAK